MKSTPSPELLSAARAAIPDLEAALATAPDFGPEAPTIEPWLAWAEETSRPLFAKYESLYRELLRAEIAATPGTEKLPRDYFEGFLGAEWTSLNSVGLLRFMLALFCASTGAHSDHTTGEEMVPCLPPPPPPRALS